MKSFKIKFLLFMFSIGIISCTPDPQPINEEELITTLKYTLTPIGGGNIVELRFEDKDGEGGNAPTITGGILDASKIYAGTLTLLNESANPPIDITEEIKDEALDHQFFYNLSSTIADKVKIDYKDVDASGNPIGIKSQVSTTGFGKGTLKITLRHEPNKSGANVSLGEITNAGGETDIEVSFDIEVK